MEEILKPLRDNIEQFRRSIDEKYTREASGTILSERED